MTPTAYGRSETSKLLPRRNGELWNILRPMVPAAFPNADPDVMAVALVGFTSTVTGWNEDTADASDPRRRAPFHEVGIGNVPAGVVAGPAPNPNPHAPYNSWGQLAGSELVRRLLGRPATMVPGAWREAHSDQVAVWLADQVRNETEARVRLPPAMRPSVAGWSAYRVGMMFAAFSVGPIGAALALTPPSGVTVPPEGERWSFVRDLAVTLRRSQTAAAVFSGDAKLESAGFVAEASNRAPDHAFVAWWASERPSGGPLDVALASLAAHHAHANGQIPAAGSLVADSEGAGAMLALGALALAGSRA